MKISGNAKTLQRWTQVPDCPWLMVGDDWMAYCSYERTAPPADRGDKVPDAAWRKSSAVGAVFCTPASCGHWSTPDKRAEITEDYVTSIPWY